MDAVACRQRDANTAWKSAADGVLEERRYYCQNFRGDVSAVVTSAGKMVEWVKYSAFGVPDSLPAGDTDSDRDWDVADLAVMAGTYDVRKDADLSGTISAADVTQANSITGGYQTLGRGVLSSTGVNNRRGYGGYERDPVLAGNKHHQRYRVYDADLGRWLHRDPAGYVDGPNLYAYGSNGGLSSLDPTGLSGNMGGGIAHTTPMGPAPFPKDFTCLGASCGSADPVVRQRAVERGATGARRTGTDSRRATARRRSSSSRWQRH